MAFCMKFDARANISVRSFFCKEKNLKNQTVKEKILLENVTYKTLSSVHWDKEGSLCNLFDLRSLQDKRNNMKNMIAFLYFRTNIFMVFMSFNQKR